MEAGNSAGDEAARSLRYAEEFRRKAAWHEQRAASFARGRVGETAVARALDELTADGYRRIDDCRWPGRPQANIDHVLIGPGGLFVIDAKNWSGHVQVRDGVLRQNGYRREKELQSGADALSAVHALLTRPVAHAGSALCLCGSADLSLGPTGAGVAVVEVDRIADWVRGHPRVLRPADVATAYEELRAKLKPAGRISAASSIPDHLPRQWPGPAPTEPSRARPPHPTAPAQRPRVSPGAALAGRILILLFLLDALGSMVFTPERLGSATVAIVCALLFLRLERGRPLLTKRMRGRG
jgi:hypothetical protein